MTKKELSQLYYITKEIERYEEQLFLAESRATAITQSLSDMPKGKSSNDKIANIVSQMVYYREMINLKKQELEIERNRLTEYINDIEDSMIRMIFTLRYIDLLTWNEVADKLGGGNTEDSVRMLHNRYLNKN